MQYRLLQDEHSLDATKKAHTTNFDNLVSPTSNPIEALGKNLKQKIPTRVELQNCGNSDTHKIKLSTIVLHSNFHFPSLPQSHWTQVVEVNTYLGQKCNLF